MKITNFWERHDAAIHRNRLLQAAATIFAANNNKQDLDDKVFSAVYDALRLDREIESQTRPECDE